MSVWKIKITKNFSKRKHLCHLCLFSRPYHVVRVLNHCFVTASVITREDEVQGELKTGWVIGKWQSFQRASDLLANGAASVVWDSGSLSLLLLSVLVSTFTSSHWNKSSCSQLGFLSPSSLPSNPLYSLFSQKAINLDLESSWHCLKPNLPTN